MEADANTAFISLASTATDELVNSRQCELELLAELSQRSTDMQHLKESFLDSRDKAVGAASDIQIGYTV